MHTATKLTSISTEKNFSKDKLSYFMSVVTILFLACMIVIFSALNFSQIMEIVKGKANAATIVYSGQAQVAPNPEPLTINF
ncbi:MAG: hypothetical protein FWF46_00405 [Oscillospiraceae bacterium]|nr:hypothetical protein [Oscillospiraceae bacterium]